MTTAVDGLGRAMAKGAAWMVLVKILRRGIGVLSTIILARLLLPEDFGLIALAQIALGLLEAMSEFGFDNALIRKQTNERKYYDTVWTLQLIRSCTVAAVTVALAVPAAAFFDEPRLEAVLYVVAFATAIAGLENVGIVDFRKNLLFHKEFIFTAAVRFTAFAVTIVLAVIWRDYWALVIGMVAARLIRVILSYILHPYRPKLSLVVWGEIMRFSKWLMLNSMIRFVVERSDMIFLGRLSGAHVLGFYSVARDISDLPTSALVAPIRRAVFPGYAKIKDDRAALTESFVETFSLILMLGAPIALVIWVTADPLVRLFLGPAWLDSIPLIEVLALFGLASICGANCGPLCLAVNKPHYNSISLVIRLSIVMPLLYFSIKEYGPIGAAWSVTIAVFLARMVVVSLVLNLLQIGPARLLAALWRIAFACAAMVFAVRAVVSASPNGHDIVSLFITLLAAACTGLVVYSIILFGLWRLSGAPAGAERNVLDLIQDKIVKRNRRARP